MDLKFIEHAKAADAAYLEYTALQRRISRIEQTVIAREGRAAYAGIALKDNVEYRILTGDRNRLMQVCLMETAMARLHGSGHW